MKNSQKIKSIIINIILWIFSIIFLIAGFSSWNIPGVFFLLAGLILLPFTTNLLKKYFKFNLSNKLKIVLAVVFIFFAGYILSLNNYKEIENQQIQQPLTIVTEDKNTIVFDIPNLLGKGLGELEDILGTPYYNKEPSETYRKTSEIRNWDKVWSKDGYSLSVTYNIDTNEVEQFFLGEDSEKALEFFKNPNNILKVGNLSLKNDKYSVEFIKLKAILGIPKSETPDGYTGAVIKEK